MWGVWRTRWHQAPASPGNISSSTLTPCCDAEPIINEGRERESNRETQRDDWRGNREGWWLVWSLYMMIILRLSGTNVMPSAIWLGAFNINWSVTSPPKLQIDPVTKRQKDTLSFSPSSLWKASVMMQWIIFLCYRQICPNKWWQCTFLQITNMLQFYISVCRSFMFLFQFQFSRWCAEALVRSGNKTICKVHVLAEKTCPE